MPINVLLVDDHALFRQGFKLLLERLLQQHSRIVEFGTAESALAAAKQEHFDLIFLDLGLPGVGGMKALSAFRQSCPTSALLVLSAIETPDIVESALALGAKGYIPKTMSMESIGGVLEQILAGKTYTPIASTENFEASPRLTGRQMEVLMEMCAGRNNREIAQRLNISENTIRAHSTSMFTLLGVRSRTEAVLLAKRKGWC